MNVKKTAAILLVLAVVVASGQYLLFKDTGKHKDANSGAITQDYG